MVMFGGGPVVYKSRCQRTVALRTVEAEYMALSLYAGSSLGTFDTKGPEHEQVGAIEVWEDNQGAIALACNVGYNVRMKHIDIRRQKNS